MTRLRTATGLAALAAITGALVFGGVTAANADDVIEITTTDVTWSGTPFAISGTVDLTNGTNPVEIRLGPDPAGAIVCAAATFDTPTTWTCNTAMTPGSYVITARQVGTFDRLDTETLQVRVPPGLGVVAEPAHGAGGRRLRHPGARIPTPVLP